MDVEIIKKEQNTITIDKAKGIVTKTLGVRPSSDNQPVLLPEWFEAYRKFQDVNPYVVRVKKLVNDHTFTMEYIPNIGTVDKWLADRKELNPTTNRTETFELIKCITSNITSSIEFSKSMGDGCLWINDDIHIHNIVVCDDNSFRIIDPDSWVLWNITNDIELANDQTYIKIRNMSRRINQTIDTAYDILRG